MFPLIAISAFFLLGIAFFIIGKDDFGIKRVKEVSNDTNLKGNEVTSLESLTKNESPTENKEMANAESSSKINPDSNVSA